MSPERSIGRCSKVGPDVGGRKLSSGAESSRPVPETGEKSSRLFVFFFLRAGLMKGRVDW